MDRMVENAAKRRSNGLTPSCNTVGNGTVCPQDLILSNSSSATSTEASLHNVANTPVAFDIDDLATYTTPPDDPDDSMDLVCGMGSERIRPCLGYMPVPQSQQAHFLQDPCAKVLDHLEQCKRCKLWLDSCVGVLRRLCHVDASYTVLLSAWNLLQMKKTQHDREGAILVPHTCEEEIEDEDDTLSLHRVKLAAGCSTLVTMHPIFKTYLSVETLEPIQMDLEAVQRYGFKGMLFPDPIHILALGLGIRDSWLAAATTCDSRITKIFILKGCRELEAADPSDVMNFIVNGHIGRTNRLMDTLRMRAGIGVQYVLDEEEEEILQWGQACDKQIDKHTYNPTKKRKSQDCQPDEPTDTQADITVALQDSVASYEESSEQFLQDRQQDEAKTMAVADTDTMNGDTPTFTQSKEPTFEGHQQDDLITEPTANAAGMTDHAPEKASSPACTTQCTLQEPKKRKAGEPLEELSCIVM
ncbi:hypothetical protein F5Y18DRAFT_436740 [Xylariaceae sp. FL1019]|nr:hypothetical protein F5Y18DRAFT_436740 [Xylariaceae sp. FL1019]